MKRVCLISVSIPAFMRSIKIANCAQNRDLKKKVDMRAQNAKLTFPGVDNAIAMQNKNVDYFGKILKYSISKSIGVLPLNGIVKDLIGDAFSYIVGDNNNDEEFDAIVKKYELKKFYSEYTEEMGEIKRSLESIQKPRKEIKEIDYDIHYCIKRCGYLVSKFENNLNHALVITVLFDELCYVYVTVGLAKVEYNGTAESAEDMINRLEKLESVIKKFKEKCVEQRVSLVKKWKDPYGPDWSYYDELREDMDSVYIVAPQAMQPISERAMNEQIARVERYKNELKFIYGNYFDRLRLQILHPVMARIEKIGEIGIKFR